jgi:hypothetical protein
MIWWLWIICSYHQLWVETSNTQKPNLMTPSLINCNQSSVILSDGHLSSAIDKIRAVHGGVIACVKMGIGIQIVDRYFVLGKLIFPWSDLFHSTIPWPSQQLLLSRKWICPMGPKFVYIYIVCVWVHVEWFEEWFMTTKPLNNISPLVTKIQGWKKNHFNIIFVFFDFGAFLPVGIFFQNETHLKFFFSLISVYSQIWLNCLMDKGWAQNWNKKLKNSQILWHAKCCVQ